MRGQKRYHTSKYVVQRSWYGRRATPLVDSFILISVQDNETNDGII